jgi:xanthine/uracil permease
MKFIQEKAIIACGVVLLLLPLTGFPRSWKTAISVLVGITVVYIGALLYKKATTLSPENKTEIKTKTFTESM